MESEKKPASSEMGLQYQLIREGIELGRAINLEPGKNDVSIPQSEGQSEFSLPKSGLEKKRFIVWSRLRDELGFSKEQADATVEMEPLKMDPNLQELSSDFFNEDGELRTIEPERWEAILYGEEESMSKKIYNSPFKEKMWIPISEHSYGFEMPLSPLEKTTFGRWNSLRKDLGYSEEDAYDALGIWREPEEPDLSDNLLDENGEFKVIPPEAQKALLIADGISLAKIISASNDDKTIHLPAVPEKSGPIEMSILPFKRELFHITYSLGTKHSMSKEEVKKTNNPTQVYPTPLPF